jgi:RNA-directed DNA polymerase
MTNAPVNLQDLRRRIYVKAKAESSWRFWGLYVHVCKLETLHAAYELARANNGAPGVDGVTFARIEDGVGVARFLQQIRDELVTRTYRPMRNRRKAIPKEGGKVRVLSIPSIRDRVVQGALKLILEPIFEADFQPGSYGYRPRKSAHDAVSHVAREIAYGKTLVIDLDLRSYFDGVRHHLLLEKVARRVSDDDVMRLLKSILKATGKKGVPQGGVISPLLSNLYLNEVDRMLEQAVQVTRDSYTYVAYARFADDLVVLVDGHHRHAWLRRAVVKRLREELARLQVEVNEDKTKAVDLTRGESFGFLGFDFRRVRSLRGKWRAQFTPRMSRRTALLRKLRFEFRRYRSRSTGELIQRVNSILRGWINYFRVGHTSRCFDYIRDWVEKKVRRHLMRARQRKGFGWKRWSSEWIHAELGLFSDYRIRYRNPVTKALPIR